MYKNTLEAQNRIDTLPAKCGKNYKVIIRGAHDKQISIFDVAHTFLTLFIHFNTSRVYRRTLTTIMAQISVFSQEQRVNSLNAEGRIKKGTSKFPLKNCIKIIDAMCKKDSTGKKSQVGSLTLVDALGACHYNAFSTSLLTFMDAERTKMVGFYADPKAKEESKLGALVEEAYALTDDNESDLSSKVEEAYNYLQSEKEKEVARAKKREEARAAEVAELVTYFVSQGMTEQDAADQASMCRIIKANTKEERPMWAIGDLFASFAYTKAEQLSAWAEDKQRAEDEIKAQKKAQKEAKAAAKRAKEAARAAKMPSAKELELEAARVNAIIGELVPAEKKSAI